MAEKIKVRLSSNNEGGYNTIKGRLVKEPIEVEITLEERQILEGEAPHIIIEDVVDDEPPAGNDDLDDLTAAELIAKIGECKTIEEVKPFFKGEKRTTVIQAAKAKIAALKDAAKVAEQNK